MQRFRRWLTLGGVAVALVGALAATPAFAQSGGAAPAPALDPAQTLRDNLVKLAAAKKGAEVTLRGGKSFRGRIGAVGDHAVLLTELEGREFYDAWISLEEIAAVEVRAR